MCGHPSAYNTYATPPTTNPLFQGFSRSQIVKQELIASCKMQKKPGNTQFSGFSYAQNSETAVQILGGDNLD